MTHTPKQNADRLIDFLRPLRRVAIAFSGGVDSSVVAAAAQRAGLEWVCAVTAESPSVARWQTQLAKSVADEIGIKHRFIPTTETTRTDYRRNDFQRCYYCKETLYAALERFCSEQNLADPKKVTAKSGFQPPVNVVMVSGTNADDLGDHRPGIEAGRRQSVMTPLADLGLTKVEVRAVAEHFGLSNHELPASPCLASRIAYGVEVTVERLRKVEQAEDWLRSQGVKDCRVRLHQDELARIEVPHESLSLLFQMARATGLARRFREFGFEFVTIDLEGFQSGKMNRVVVPIELPADGRLRESVP